MPHLLHIDATTFAAESISRQVARTFREAWTGEVVHRDLAADPIPHLTPAALSARFSDPAGHTPEEAKAAALQNELIDEFLAAGGYLFTVPMYNYAAPSSFKAWLDQIVVPGRTMAFPDGPPTAGRPALVISSRGGAYGPGAPNRDRDHLIPHLREILGTELGLELDFITPEFGLAPVVAHMAAFLENHHASLAESHTQAGLRAAEFTLRKAETS